MEPTFIIISAIALWAIAATAHALATDGYHRVPTRENGRGDPEGR